MMLKALVVLVAVLIAVINISAQGNVPRGRVVRRIGVVKIGPTTTYLKQGLTTEEVVRLLGEPTSVTQPAASDGAVTYEFQRSEGKVLVAEFVAGSLVSSRTEMRTNAHAGH